MRHPSSRQNRRGYVRHVHYMRSPAAGDSSREPPGPKRGPGNQGIQVTTKRSKQRLRIRRANRT